MKIWSEIYIICEIEIIYLHYYIIKSFSPTFSQFTEIVNFFILDFSFYHKCSKFVLLVTLLIRKNLLRNQKNTKPYLLLNRGLKSPRMPDLIIYLPCTLRFHLKLHRALRCKLARDTIAQQSQTFLLWTSLSELIPVWNDILNNVLMNFSILMKMLSITRCELERSFR